MIHELKTHPPYFQSVLEGKRTHEVRVNDRNFRVGDFLRLREFFPREVTGKKEGTYTGREVLVAVTYVTLGGAWNLPDNLCVLSICRWATEEEIDAWLYSGERLQKGDRVPLYGHEGHTIEQVRYEHTPEKMRISVQCSCFWWLGDNAEHPRSLRALSIPSTECTTPNGRKDCHGKYVETLGGVMVCAFCKSPQLDKFKRAP